MRRLIPVNNDFDEKKLDGINAQPDSADANPFLVESTLGPMDPLEDMRAIEVNFADLKNVLGQGEEIYNAATIHFERIATPSETGQVRVHAVNTDGDWKEIAFSDNLATYLSPNGVNYQFLHWYVEGTHPGKMTLRLTYSKGDLILTFDKNVDVCTQKPKSAWQTEVNSQIYLETGVGGIPINLANYNPLDGFDVNKEFIKTIYQHYELQYMRSSSLFLWAGMAKLAGAPVYAGLSDSVYGEVLLPGVSHLAMLEMRTILMSMNRDIYLDRAWQDRAFEHDGYCSLLWVADNDPTLAPGEADDIRDAWSLIDQGQRENDPILILRGNYLLLLREQKKIVPSGYAALDALGVSWAMTRLAENPMPTGVDFHTSVPEGNLTVFADRWMWIDHAPTVEHPNLGMWQIYSGANEGTRQAWVGQSFKTRAEGFRYHFPFFVGVQELIW